VPLVEYRHRSWLEPRVARDTLAFLREHGLAFVSVDSPDLDAANVMPRLAAATHPVACVRFHGRNAATWNVKGARASWERFDWNYSREELAEWVDPLRSLAGEAEEVYALFNVNRGAQAPRGAALLRGLLDDASVPATGAAEPEPATLFCPLPKEERARHRHNGRHVRRDDRERDDRRRGDGELAPRDGGLRGAAPARR
jgi:uncharacterized protein YecE (DUF72 family)